MTKVIAVRILTTMFLGLSGWTMTEVANLKERVKGNEVTRENMADMIKEIRQDQKEMNQKLDQLLENQWP